MLSKTQGIVLGHIKFKESSIIVKIYTKDFGLQSYIVNGVRSARSKGKIAYFQPLSILDLVVYNSPGKDIQRLSEFKFLHHFRSIPFEIRKTTIAIFLAELLSKSIRSTEPDAQLFDFIVDSFSEFDERVSGIEHFHLTFLYDYTYHLGIQPESIQAMCDEIRDEINTKQEMFLTKIDQSEIEMFLNDRLNMSLNNVLRRKFLLTLRDYFRMHISELGEINSLSVLNEIFH